jgi:hypothetical protein
MACDTFSFSSWHWMNNRPCDTPIGRSHPSALQFPLGKLWITVSFHTLKCLTVNHKCGVGIMVTERSRCTMDTLSGL